MRKNQNIYRSFDSDIVSFGICLCDVLHCVIDVTTLLLLGCNCYFGYIYLHTHYTQESTVCLFFLSHRRPGRIYLEHLFWKIGVIFSEIDHISSWRWISSIELGGRQGVAGLHLPQRATVIVENGCANSPWRPSTSIKTLILWRIIWDHMSANFV